MQQIKFDVIPENYDKYKNLEIKTDKDAAFVGERASEVKAEIRKVDEQRKEYTRPLDESKRRIMADAKAIITPLEAILRILDHKLCQWTENQEKAREEAARAERDRILKALEEKRKAELAVAISTGDDKAAETVDEISKNMKIIEEKPITVDRAIRGDQGTVAFQKRWTFEVEDVTKVPKKFMTVDEKKIRAHVLEHKDTKPIKGVRIFQETKTIHKR